MDLGEQEYDRKDVEEMAFRTMLLREDKYTDKDVLETLQDPIYGLSEDEAQQVLEEYNLVISKNSELEKPKRVNGLAKKLLNIGKVSLEFEFAFPTFSRKVRDLAGTNHVNFLLGVAQLSLDCFFYHNLFDNNPTLGYVILGAQLASNVVSGVYEVVRDLKKSIYEENHKAIDF